MIKKIILGASILLFAIIFIIKFEKESAEPANVKDNWVAAPSGEEIQKFEELLLSYNDPFEKSDPENSKPLARLMKPTQPIRTPSVKIKENVSWPDVKIIGEIRGKSTSQTIYIVRVDKSEFSLFEGDFFDTLCLKKVKSGEFIIQTPSGILKTFQRTSLN